MRETTPLPLIVYGAIGCDDTERVVDYLRRLNIPFQEVIIDQDPEAERFLIFINNGNRSTPTLVFGAGRRKLVLTEPTAKELVQALKEAGYETRR